MVKILKCEKCESIIQVFVEGDTNACDSHMIEIPVKTEGEKASKHKPVIEIDGDNVTIKIGELQHPMDENHYIQFILLEVADEQYTKYFKPEDIPEISFTIAENKISKGIVAKAFCNIHGLWSSE